jgi:hypothetical protein
VKFELEHKRCCPSELRRGEAKRIPKNPLHPACGFYVGCPSCGRPQTVTTRAIDPDLGQVCSETSTPAGALVVTFEPGHTCSRCGVRFSVQANEVVIHA